ncbi:MAG: addiction module protein [Spirochaetia bacterium]|jgi:hypothetical protein|nr:addiction module protein [Spirochaetia bacterium]
MEAIRFIEEIDSNTVTLKNLDRFKGKKVEIIILPYETNITEFDKEWALEAEDRIQAFNDGKIEALDGEQIVSELKEKYSLK